MAPNLDGILDAILDFLVILEGLKNKKVGLPEGGSTFIITEADAVINPRLASTPRIP